MSGKFEKNKKTKTNPTRKYLWTVIILLVLVLAGMMVSIICLEDRESVPEVTEPAPETTQTAPADTGETVSSAETPEVDGIFDLGSGVLITEYLSYTGAFMEDRSDEVVADVLAIRVTNTGDEYIQLMDITLTAGDTRAEFSLSTLFPGETVIVLEKNRMDYNAALEFTGASASNVALFQAAPSLCADRLEIQCLNGVLNITNISDEDITGDIYIYFKNCIQDIYYGGITYRIRIQGGLKAGEVRQGAAAHFNPDNSTVVFVTCG